MHVHFLGICGTFMGGLAVLARAAGYKVTGSDRNVYPPMSTELQAHGIEIIQGYEADQLDLNPDLIVVGNVMKRGMPVIERMLNEGRRYVSGPQWLEEHYLYGKKVLAVAGTHGKTTTSSMLAWILDYCGLNPGFLIGGVPENFGCSARSTASPYFVIEADEYDCAFFDKRSKFVHYHPLVQILNNLEYDHADIFPNLEAIERQFHHLVRTIPACGKIVMPKDCAALNHAIAMGCWTPIDYVNHAEGLHGVPDSEDGCHFDLYDGNRFITKVNSPAVGIYNMHNAVAAIAAAAAIGVEVSQAAQALAHFVMPKRRLELKGEAGGVKVYDDFAHHPTAVRVTLEGLRAHVGAQAKIIAVFEPRSNSMKLGANREELAPAFAAADAAFVYAPDTLSWDAASLIPHCPVPMIVEHDFQNLVQEVVKAADPGSIILVMSNGSFNGIHQKLLAQLAVR